MSVLPLKQPPVVGRSAMTKRTRYIIAAVLTLSVAAIAVLLAWPAPPVVPGITRENFARIRHGMTLKEVEGIFGRPCDGFIEHDELPRPPVMAEWDVKELQVEVFIHLGDDDRVIGKQWGKEPEGWIERISRWVRKP